MPASSRPCASTRSRSPGTATSRHGGGRPRRTVRCSPRSCRATAMSATTPTSSSTRTARSRRLDDILKCDKSLDFGIGDPNSTSGFLVPTSYIFAASNIDPKSCFKTVRNANHQANAMAVANKQVAAATNNSEDLQRVAATAPRRAQPDQDHLDLAADPARSAGVAQGPRSRREDEALHVPDELRPHSAPTTRSRRHKKILADLVWSPFHPSSDNQLLPIRSSRRTRPAQGAAATPSSRRRRRRSRWRR